MRGIFSVLAALILLASLCWICCGGRGTFPILVESAQGSETERAAPDSRDAPGAGAPTRTKLEPAEADARGQLRTSEHDSGISSIEGRVVTRAGEGVPGMMVVATPPRVVAFDRHMNSPLQAPDLAGSMSSAKTDDEGRFRISKLKSGEYELHARPSNLAERPWLRWKPSRGQTAQAGSQGIVLIFDGVPTGTVRGRIERTGSERAVPFVDVCIAGAGDPPWPFRRIAVVNGAFRLAEVSAGSYGLTLMVPESERVDMPVGVEAGRVTDIGIVRLREYARISGWVFDMAGKPLPGVKILLNATPLNTQKPDAVTDSRGFFECVRMCSHGVFLLVWKKKHAPISRLLTPDKPYQNLEFQLLPSGSIRVFGLSMGWTGEMKGVPVEYLRRSLRLVPADAPSTSRGCVDRGLHRSFDSAYPVPFFDGIPAGSYRIEVWAEDSRPASKNSRWHMGLENRRVTLQPGQLLSVDWSKSEKG